MLSHESRTAARQAEAHDVRYVRERERERAFDERGVGLRKQQRVAERAAEQRHDEPIARAVAASHRDERESRKYRHQQRLRERTQRIVAREYRPQIGRRDDEKNEREGPGGGVAYAAAPGELHAR
jgi:hypothetical protein